MLSIEPPEASTQSAVPVCPLLIIEESAMLTVPPSIFTVAILSLLVAEPYTAALFIICNVAPSPINRAAPVEVS